MDRRNRLRIMQSSEVIDMAIRVYQVLGWTFLKITIVPSLFCVSAVAFFLRYVWPAYFETSHPGSQAQQMMEVASTTALALFVAAPLYIIGVSYTSVVVTHLVSDYMVGNAPSAEAAENRGRQLLGKLFLLNLREVLLSCGGILVSLALMALSAYIASVTSESDASAALVLIVAWIGMIAGCAFFLYIISKHALAPAVMTLEGTTVKQAAKRSSTLLKSYGFHGSGGNIVWMLYGLLLILWLLVGLGISVSFEFIGFPENARGLISGLPFSGLILEALRLIPTFLVIWTLTPVWAATTTIIYYDRRIRLEGYDIEALAEDVWRADRSRRFEL
jgi:hypothetical protein